MQQRTALFMLDDLECRARGGRRRISGKFRYGKTAVLSAGRQTGKPVKEIMGPDAFGYSVRESGNDISLLQGHSFDRILGSRNNKSLRIDSDNDAVIFRAEIDPAIERLGYVEETIGQIDAGLIAGISPGFMLPPARAVKDAVTETREPVDTAKGMHGATIQTINAAVLYELSLVARPAYADASDVAVRSEDNDPMTKRGLMGCIERARRMRL